MDPKTAPRPEHSVFSDASPIDCTGEVPVGIKDGVAWLRPLRRDETEPLHAVFDAMSPTSRYTRYLSPATTLSRDMTRLLTAIDGTDHVAWLATIDERPAGIARYVKADPTTAELAFEVTDHHHGRGLGTALIDTVTTIAAAAGITDLQASVLGSNQASKRLLSLVGLALTRQEGGVFHAAGPLRLLQPARIDRTAVLRLAPCTQLVPA
jgi:RimJ/RimL family protein N-acetyltransferase